MRIEAHEQPREFASLQASWCALEALGQRVDRLRAIDDRAAP
jgi:hypothetical protein